MENKKTIEIEHRGIKYKCQLTVIVDQNEERCQAYNIKGICGSLNFNPPKPLNEAIEYIKEELYQTLK